MFSSNFYPTPRHVIELILEGEILKNKTILEPSAGKGDIVDFCIGSGATAVIACELNEDLKKIVSTKCPVIGDDFLKLESHVISHIDLIIMNPPFESADKHILHAFNIAPPGCKIIALCNFEMVNNHYSNRRRELLNIIEQYGNTPQNLGDCFSNAERKTDVEVGLIKIQKAGSNYSTEFEGFFTEEDKEEAGEIGIMSYNLVRDLVNRYVGSIKIFDEQLAAAVKMNALTNGFYTCKLGLNLSEDNKPVQRNEFKKAMQKSGWAYIFDKMNMKKYATTGLKEDINKFVEQQVNIPFTMINIYKMLDIVIGTTSQRMDKALLEVFDAVTNHHADNRFSVEGWKTNSHYLVNQKFILPYICPVSKWNDKSSVDMMWGSRSETLDDMQKALCYITGVNYESCKTLKSFISDNNCQYGEWYSWGFFEIKGFKKGSMHFKFNDADLWGQFNQRISRLKGYPLYEPKSQTKWQERQNKRA